LSDDGLTSEYYNNCEEMAHRIRAMREKLVEVLKEVGSTHDWSHVTEQIGMFAFTGECPSFHSLHFSRTHLLICLRPIVYFLFFLTNSTLMHTLSGMSSDMCDQLTSEYAIYLTRDGRISLAGLNDGNIEYVAKAIHAVTDGKSITS